MPYSSNLYGWKIFSTDKGGGGGEKIHTPIFKNYDLGGFDLKVNGVWIKKVKV